MWCNVTILSIYFFLFILSYIESKHTGFWSEMLSIAEIDFTNKHAGHHTLKSLHLLPSPGKQYCERFDDLMFALSNPHHRYHDKWRNHGVAVNISHETACSWFCGAKQTQQLHRVEVKKKGRKKLKTRWRMCNPYQMTRAIINSAMTKLWIVTEWKKLPADSYEEFDEVYLKILNSATDTEYAIKKVVLNPCQHRWW